MQPRVGTAASRAHACSGGPGMSYAQATTACKRLSDALDDEEHKRLLVRVRKCLAKQQRELVVARHRARAEVDVLRSELHGELVDREANAVRVNERQRVLFERQEALAGQSSAHERAQASAAYLEAALVSLDVNAHSVGLGCEALYNSIEA